MGKASRREIRKVIQETAINSKQKCGPGERGAGESGVPEKTKWVSDLRLGIEVVVSFRERHVGRRSRGALCFATTTGNEAEIQN